MSKRFWLPAILISATLATCPATCPATAAEPPGAKEAASFRVGEPLSEAQFA